MAHAPAPPPLVVVVYVHLQRVARHDAHRDHRADAQEHSAMFPAEVDEGGEVDERAGDAHAG